MKKIIAFTSVLLISIFAHNLVAQPLIPSPKSPAKIQAAILLDVSNSMDGLIDQAKAQLWNMVSVMGKAVCDDNSVPTIEIALFEYGRSSNDAKQGYVKMISPFTTDLDELSKKLFALTTNGGDEYCGQVMLTSLQNLNWDTSPKSYKTIFISGNEDFLQGSISYIVACNEAKKKGVIINTIYCGDKLSGIREHWNLGSECGEGSFSNIDQTIKIQEIPTPYDPVLFSLNDSLNATYVYYGTQGASKYADQAGVDEMNYQSNKTAAVKRVSVKASKQLYNNAAWDLVDAEKSAPGTVQKVEMKSLPKELQNKTRKELDAFIVAKQKKREAYQQQITTITKKREAYIAAERAKNKTEKVTLESAVETALKSQVKKYKMKIND